MTPDKKILGLIAGQGRLPFLVAKGAKKAGLKVVCVGLAENSDPQLADEVDHFYQVAIARPGSWIRKLKKHGVTETIMVGRVAKGRLFTPWRILRYLPDWRALRTWYWRLRTKNKLTDTILNALSDELESGGIILENSIMYCTEHLARQGTMTKHRPDFSNKADIEFGSELAKKLAELDIGQAITVKEKEILAVEAIEGTAKMLERTGQVCKKRGWTLIKVARPNQDMRFDVPCVGPDTVNSLAKFGGNCIAVEAKKVLIIDIEKTIKLADELGIAIVGF